MNFRTQAVGIDGKPIDDFVIEPHGNTIHVLNAPSLATTASLAIADHIVKMAAEQFKFYHRAQENNRGKK